MQGLVLKFLTRILLLVALALVIKVTCAILLEYPKYVPPDFNSLFLLGREPYFWHGYHLAFYAHILSGPIALILAVVLLFERVRQRHARWHRCLGKLQIATVLLFVAPSGLAMSFWADGGAPAQLAFMTLAAATGYSAWAGWRHAIAKRYAPHREWMLRCAILLMSAVVLRVIGGFFEIVEVDAEWTYILAAWTSWLVPIIAFEISRSKYAARLKQRMAGLPSP